MTENIEKIMQEPPGGFGDGRQRYEVGGSNNHGGATAGGVPVGRDREMSVAAAQTSELIMDGSGVGFVDTTAGTHNGSTYGYRDMGMTTHRGVLHPDEYVHTEELAAMVEEELGFTIGQLHSVYSRAGGPLPTNLRPLREAIDARLLALSASGANMTALGEACGLSDIAVDRAVARAKAAEEAA